MSLARYATCQRSNSAKRRERKLPLTMSSYGPSSFGGGMKAVDRPSRGHGRAGAADLTLSAPSQSSRKFCPRSGSSSSPAARCSPAASC